jgi:hypothetical protein
MTATVAGLMIIFAESNASMLIPETSRGLFMQGVEVVGRDAFAHRSASPQVHAQE